jgi:hypothetical protein
MNKRLMKRHERQVTRARERVRLSEPDVRTPEQIKAAREASRPGGARAGLQALYATPPVHNSVQPAAGAVPKAGE